MQVLFIGWIKSGVYDPQLWLYLSQSSSNWIQLQNSKMYGPLLFDTVTRTRALPFRMPCLLPGGGSSFFFSSSLSPSASLSCPSFRVRCACRVKNGTCVPAQELNDCPPNFNCGLPLSYLKTWKCICISATIKVLNDFYKFPFFTNCVNKKDSQAEAVSSLQITF